MSQIHSNLPTVGKRALTEFFLLHLMPNIRCFWQDARQKWKKAIMLSQQKQKNYLTTFANPVIIRLKLLFIFSLCRLN